MKTIKIIDLLNKIANDEELPKKIKYDYKIETDIPYFMYGKMGKCSNDTMINFLNDEVEILEEKNIPEKLEELGKITYDLGFIDYKNIEELKNWLNQDIQSILNELDLIVKNQNQIIDYLESKEKGE